MPLRSDPQLQPRTFFGNLLMAAAVVTFFIILTSRSYGGDCGGTSGRFRARTVTTTTACAPATTYHLPAVQVAPVPPVVVAAAPRGAVTVASAGTCASGTCAVGGTTSTRVRIRVR